MIATFASRFEQEPGATLRFIDPDLYQAGGRDVAVFVADVVDLAKSRGQRLVVSRKLGEHVPWFDIVRIVVRHSLQSGDVTNGFQRGAAHLADALSDGIRHGKQLVALLVRVAYLAG